MDDVDCLPPEPAEVGDTWICPGCAVKWEYIVFDDLGIVTNAWFTREIGF